MKLLKVDSRFCKKYTEGKCLWFESITQSLVLCGNCPQTPSLHSQTTLMFGHGWKKSVWLT